MTENWEIDPLIELSKLKGNSEFIIGVLDSFQRADNIFLYHLTLAIELNKELKDLSVSDLILSQYKNNNEKTAKIAEMKLGLQANIHGCIYSVRGLLDLFSQLVNDQFINGELTVGKCDIKKVESKLDDSKLKKALSNLIESKEFEYINGFVNTIKHRNLVKTGSISSNVENKSGIVFVDFEYGGKQFKQMWAEDILDMVMKVQQDFLYCGSILNKELEL